MSCAPSGSGCRPPAIPARPPPGLPPPGWTAAILDRRHVTVARKGERPELPGEPATRERISRITTSGEGSFLDTTPEGTRLYTAVSHSPRLGWTVGLDVPVETGNAP